MLKKNNRLNNHDFNIDQKICDNDFFHTQADISLMYQSCVLRRAACARLTPQDRGDLDQVPQ